LNGILHSQAFAYRLCSSALVVAVYSERESLYNTSQQCARVFHIRYKRFVTNHSVGIDKW